MTLVLFWVWGTASFIMSVFYNSTSAQLSAEIPWKLQDQHSEEDWDTAPRCAKNVYSDLVLRWQFKRIGPVTLRSLA